MRKALFQPPSHTFGSHWVKYSWCFSRRSQLAHVRNSSQSPFSSFPQHSRLASVTQCGFIVVGFLNPSSSPVNALRVGLGNLLIILDRPQMLVILLGILSQGLSYIYNRACNSLLSSLTICLKIINVWTVSVGKNMLKEQSPAVVIFEHLHSSVKGRFPNFSQL